MTTYAYYLLRLHGTETWADWGDDWLKHADLVGVPRLRPAGSGVSRSSLQTRTKGIQLDCGTTLYELTKEELDGLPGDAFFEGCAVPGARYGVAVVELY